jgi:hypothetical protein
MKKNMLILPLTAALLAACGGAPVPVTLNTLTVGGVTGPLKIEAPAKLTVTATGTDGNPFTGTATFTSSDPNVVAVAADGSLTVRHLSTVPVTLTVTEAGKTASLDVKTYGLDFAPGTLLYSNGTVGTAVAIRYIDAAGNGLAADAPLSIQGPAGFNKGAALTATYPKAFGTSPLLSDAYYNVTALDGQYVATLTVGDTTFTKTATLNTKSLLGLPKNINISVTRTDVTVTGTLPDGTGRLNINVLNSSDSSTTAASTPNIYSVPTTVALSKPLNPGAYQASVIARSSYFNANVVTTPMPDQVNMAYLYIPITVN